MKIGKFCFPYRTRLQVDGIQNGVSFQKRSLISGYGGLGCAAKQLAPVDAKKSASELTATSLLLPGRLPLTVLFSLQPDGYSGLFCLDKM